jgi:CBS domain-containing protein
MPQRVRELMTPNPVILDARATAMAAARQMAEHDVGDVLVQRGGALCGIVTDRDIVVRCLAAGNDPSQPLEELCTADVATLDADSTVGDAIELMESRAVRRIPIVDAGTPIGIVSLGDLARARDPESALGRISSAPAT